MNLMIYKPDGTIEGPEVEEEAPYYLECKYFVDCVDKNKPIENGTFEDGRNALELPSPRRNRRRNRRRSSSNRNCGRRQRRHRRQNIAGRPAAAYYHRVPSVIFLL